MVPNLGMSAEHGSFIKAPGSDEWVNMTESLDMSWMSEVEEIFKYYTERTTGSTIEMKKASVTWHYRQADPVFGEFQSKQCLDLLESSVAPRRPIEGKFAAELTVTYISSRYSPIRVRSLSHGRQEKHRMSSPCYQQGRNRQANHLPEPGR